MLGAIKAMNKSTKNILKSATIHASIGVRHGSPFSCFFFVMYSDYMVRMIKSAVGTDGFWGVTCTVGWCCHIGNQQKNGLKKEVVIKFCCESVMKINEEKIVCVCG